MIIIKNQYNLIDQNSFTIDTLTLSTQVHPFEISEDKLFISDYDYILENFRHSKEEEKLICSRKHEGINLKFYKDHRILHMRFNLSEILGKANNFYIQDYEDLIQRLNSDLFFLKYIDWENIQLQRIDYKLDYHTKHKDLYLKLLHKCKSTHYSLTNQEYEDSCYYKSKAKNINIYDKQSEREAKLKDISPEDEDLLRFEVQIKWRYLHYQLKNSGTLKTLFNYIASEDAREHLQKILKPIIYQGNFYNLYHSRKRLEQFYSTKTVNSLIEFQTKISRNGIDKVIKEVGYQNFSRKILKLNDAKVNPIPIPKHYGVTFLENPIFKFNIENDNKKIA